MRFLLLRLVLFLEVLLIVAAHLISATDEQDLLTVVLGLRLHSLLLTVRLSLLGRWFLLLLF